MEGEGGRRDRAEEQTYTGFWSLQSVLYLEAGITNFSCFTWLRDAFHNMRNYLSQAVIPKWCLSTAETESWITCNTPWRKNGALSFFFFFSQLYWPKKWDKNLDHKDWCFFFFFTRFYHVFRSFKVRNERNTVLKYSIDLQDLFINWLTNKQINQFVLIFLSKETLDYASLTATEHSSGLRHVTFWLVFIW